MSVNNIPNALGFLQQLLCTNELIYTIMSLSKYSYLKRLLAKLMNILTTFCCPVFKWHTHAIIQGMLLKNSTLPN